MRTVWPDRVGAGAVELLDHRLPEHHHLRPGVDVGLAESLRPRRPASCGSRSTRASCRSRWWSSSAPRLDERASVRSAGAARAHRAELASGWPRGRPRSAWAGSRSRRARRPAVDEPGRTMRRLVPIAANVCSTRPCAPSPMAIMAMTAADADDDAERREERAHLVAPERAGRRAAPGCSGFMPAPPRRPSGNSAGSARIGDCGRSVRIRPSRIDDPRPA